MEKRSGIEIRADFVYFADSVSLIMLWFAAKKNKEIRFMNYV